MKYRRLVAYGCILLILIIPFQSIPSSGSFQNLSSRGVNWNPNSPPRTFEDLFFPHWFENGTYEFDVPEYMHKFKLASTNIWAKYYQYGAEKGRKASIKVSDNRGVIYWNFNNTNDVNGAPIGGPGRYKGCIEGTKLIIKITGKSLIQFGIWGSWFENIIEGGVYNITFPGKRIALYMDYYNPTNIHTFYFKASKPVYAYLFGWDGKLLSYTTEASKEGSVTEPYDATPFLVFVRPDNVEGNITVQFWMGYEEKKVDYTGVAIMAGVFILIVVVGYVYAKRSIYGKGGRK